MRRSAILLALAGIPSLVRAQASVAKLRLAAIPSDALTPLYYGLHNGAFQRAGIDLEILSTSSGSAATAAVIAGAYDIANTSLLPVMNAHLRGIPITIVAPQGLYTRDAQLSLLQIAADSPYKTGADLNGKVVAAAALNDHSQLCINAWVDKNGGDAGSLKFVEIPAIATEEALVQHRVAAGLLLEPALDASIAAGRTKTLGDPDSAIAPMFMYAAYVGRIDWAKEHADLLGRFVRVAGLAAAYTNAHPGETAAMMAEITKIPLPIMQHMKRAVCATTMEPRLIQPLIDVAARYKFIAQAFPAKDILFS